MGAAVRRSPVNARAMGEFGAVSVVSGHIRGQTNTIPLQVEILYNEYSLAAAFSLASLLAFLAVVTLGLKAIFEGVSVQGKRVPLCSLNPPSHPARTSSPGCLCMASRSRALEMRIGAQSISNVD